MRICCLPIVSVAMLVFASVPSALGQQPAAAGNISLDVVVSSKSEGAVGGLTAADFKVLDNKVVKPITSFKEVTGAEAQTQVILVVDAANLPYSRLSYERQQVEQLLTANGGHLAQPMTVGVLTDKGLQIHPTPTTNGNELRETLDSFNIGLRNIPNSTGFYGAVERYQLSLKAMHLLVDYEAPRPGRKLILWISPGWPLLSGPEVNLTADQERSLFSDIVALSSEMREGHVRLDAVNPVGTAENMSETMYYENFLKGVRSAREAQIGNLGLQVIAIESGGLVLNSSNDIVGMLQHCIDQTKTFYEISFAASPGDKPNEFHAIQVQVLKPGLTAYTTTGYYAHATFRADDTGPTVTPTR